MNVLLKANSCKTLLLMFIKLLFLFAKSPLAVVNYIFNVLKIFKQTFFSSSNSDGFLITSLFKIRSGGGLGGGKDSNRKKEVILGFLNNCKDKNCSIAFFGVDKKSILNLNVLIQNLKGYGKLDISIKHVEQRIINNCVEQNG